MRRFSWLATIMLSVFTAAWVARAASSNDLLVMVKVTGAVTRTGGYQHALDGTHRCVASLEVPPGPAPGSHFFITPFTVDFDSATRPPASSFRLELPGLNHAPGTHPALEFRIAMTAGGRFWHGESPQTQAAIQTDRQGLTGVFRIADLRTDGSSDTITVEGAWTCPNQP